MITFRFLFGFSIGAFVIGWSFLIIGLVAQYLSENHPTNPITLMAFPWWGLGVLAAWTAQIVRAQDARIAKLESQLSANQDD